MPEILFTRTVTVQRTNGRTFEAGKVYDLPAASVQHWVSRDAGTTDRAAIAAVRPAPPVVQLVGERPDGADLGERTGDFLPPAPGDASLPPAIPETWRDLDWPELRSLAASVSSTPVRSKAEAEAAIEAELARRAPAP